jgi:hypothetical protein
LWLNGKTLRGKTATKELQPRMARIKNERFLIRGICEIRGEKSSRDDYIISTDCSAKAQRRKKIATQFHHEGHEEQEEKEILYPDFVCFAFFVVRKLWACLEKTDSKNESFS